MFCKAVITLCIMYVMLLTASIATAEDAGVQELNVRTHSLHAPYLDASLENRYWAFGGTTVVSNNKYIRLTPDRQSKRGWLWSKQPFEYDNWSVEFEFKIDGQGTRVYGDGLAFWFVEDQEPKTGPAFGYSANFKGLGVFFDTYPNGKHQTVYFPYVGVQISDGTIPYSNDDDNFSNNMGGCEARFRKAGHPTRAKVTYFAKVLTVELDVVGNNHWTSCVTLPNVILPKSGYLGFTAATGDVADDHDIISISSTMFSLPNRPRPPLEAAIPRVLSNEEIERHKKAAEAAKASNTAWVALLYTVVVIVTIAGVIALFIAIRASMNARKKF